MRHPAPTALALAVLVLAALSAGPAAGADGASPAWLEQARRDAADEGYRVVRTAGAQSLMQNATDLLILDARPDYEFRRGHLPGAVNYEFDLADEQHLSPERAREIQALVGPDKSRPVLVYCRSFR